MAVDINCDMGEGFGHFSLGNDERIMPWISSCNVACGFHAGDPVQMEKTLLLAKKYGVRVGAHPGYPDLAGFGRREMNLSSDELRTGIKYQLAAISGMARCVDLEIAYVKPHGALYNKMAREEREAEIVMSAIREFQTDLPLMGLAGSPLAAWTSEFGLEFIAEAFADRRYGDDGFLLPRSHPAALMEKVDEIVGQVTQIINFHRIYSNTGKPIPIVADTICVHGDHFLSTEAVQKLSAFR